MRYLWAGPWTIVGLILSLMFRSRSVTRGVVVAEGASWPGRLGWGYRAITFGHVILSIDELDPATLDHELVHVRQYESWGLFFPFVYGVAALATVIRGGHYYRDNPFEIAARRKLS